MADVPRRVAKGIAWIAGTALVLGVLCALVGVVSGTDDPHGGGLAWAVGVGIAWPACIVLVLALGVLAMTDAPP